MFILPIFPPAIKCAKVQFYFDVDKVLLGANKTAKNEKTATHKTIFLAIALKYSSYFLTFTI
jgi:hypothetical protein